MLSIRQHFRVTQGLTCMASTPGARTQAGSARGRQQHGARHGGDGGGGMTRSGQSDRACDGMRWHASAAGCRVETAPINGFARKVALAGELSCLIGWPAQAEQPGGATTTSARGYRPVLPMEAAIPAMARRRYQPRLSTGVTSRRGEPTNSWRGRPIFCSGSEIISFHWAIQPTVRAMAKMQVNIEVGMPSARCTIPE
ncbi:hypothetical protein PMI40_01824 [Herbaspirillum sp. YR522]|nr:hypothetical protein PMI40_01824 [Herbaspirillum sp. YR522]